MIMMMEHTLSGALKEESNDKDLKASHSDHHQGLDDRKIKDATFGASNGTKVTILPRPEIFLVSSDGRQLGGEFEDGFFKDGRLFGRGSLFRR